MSEENSSDYVLTSVENGVRIIKFNRPAKRNAINLVMCQKVINILNEDASNDAVVVTILTGAGEHFSSGADINVFEDNLKNSEKIEKSIRIIKQYIAAFINYPKLLVAVVNGPAIGIAVTTLPLCDIVYASDNASFATPFVNLGLCPEGCSSYLFPRIMGRSKATEILILGHKMSAQEAYNCGLISEVVPYQKLEELFQRIKKYGQLPINFVKCAKRLIVENLKDKLNEVNEREITEVKKCFQSVEYFKAISKFVSKKK